MKNKIIAFYKKNRGASLKAKQLAAKLNIAEEQEYAALKAFLHSLVEEGFLEKQGKKYRQLIEPASGRVQGVLQLTMGGYGFVVPLDKKMSDIFVAERNTGIAFHGDTVEVTLFAEQKGKGRRLEGQIAAVLKRKWHELAGTLRRDRSLFYMVPDVPEIHKDIFISPEHLNGAKEGDKIVSGDITWESPNHNPQGKVVQVITDAGTPAAEIAAIAREYGIPARFTKGALEEARAVSKNFTTAELAGREDFRGKNVFTIDPEDAKDFDDALSIAPIEGGNYEIGIHIADVSHYVVPGSELDKEAYRRGNSTYLVGTVLPMLPHELSSDICSLVPAEDRLTYSVIIEITPRGRIIKHRIAKTIIHSKRRFTYAEAQKVLDTGTGDLAQDLLMLNKIALLLRNKRMKDGSINFFSDEVKITLGADGVPLSITKRELQASNMLIEEYMLLANQIVAAEIGKKRPGHTVKPFVYRVHDLPDTEKLKDFAAFVKTLGYKFDYHQAKNPLEFNRLMNEVKGTGEDILINELAIRSMAKAVYAPDNIGHFGLGFKYYSHFTSPIRRYADLVVHRLLHVYTKGTGKPLYSHARLEELCEHISAAERGSMEAEREHVKMKQILYLSKHIGDEFDAIISGVTNFGIFVKLTSILAEGLVHVRDLDRDYFVFDEKKYALVGKRTKQALRLGDKLTVQLARLDETRQQIDFRIVWD